MPKSIRLRAIASDNLACQIGEKAEEIRRCRRLPGKIIRAGDAQRLFHSRRNFITTAAQKTHPRRPYVRSPKIQGEIFACLLAMRQSNIRRKKFQRHRAAFQPLPDLALKAPCRRIHLPARQSEYLLRYVRLRFIPSHIGLPDQRRLL